VKQANFAFTGSGKVERLDYVCARISDDNARSENRSDAACIHLQLPCSNLPRP
jgi:hypothetical protein